MRDVLGNLGRRLLDQLGLQAAIQQRAHESHAQGGTHERMNWIVEVVTPSIWCDVVFKATSIRIGIVNPRPMPSTTMSRVASARLESTFIWANMYMPHDRDGQPGRSS